MATAAAQPGPSGGGTQDELPAEILAMSAEDLERRTRLLQARAMDMGRRRRIGATGAGMSVGALWPSGSARPRLLPPIGGPGK